VLCMAGGHTYSKKTATVFCDQYLDSSLRGWDTKSVLLLVDNYLTIDYGLVDNELIHKKYKNINLLIQPMGDTNIVLQ